MRRGGTAGAPSFWERPQPVHYRSCLTIALPERGAPAEPRRSGSWQPRWGGQRVGGLERLDLLGLRALGPPDGRVLNSLVFLKAAVTVSLDGGVVNEDVVSAVVRGDKTVPLVGVEPLHSALSHVPSLGGTIFGTRARPGLVRTNCP